MIIDKSETSILEKYSESGLNTFGLALMDLTDNEYLHLLITLGESQTTKPIYQ